ncbi:hypothetical protein WS62_02740 [Burkholderia sp. ABCPW 14]|nr:hypothetical protein WS62_02740 [Burkholderia sp. ABCPW 14]
MDARRIARRLRAARGNRRVSMKSAKDEVEKTGASAPVSFCRIRDDATAICPRVARAHGHMFG